MPRLIDHLVALLNRPTPKPEPEPLPEGRTHDYTRRGWGHDYVIHHVIDDGQELRCSGWGPAFGNRIVRGDYLLLVSKPESQVDSTRYQVAEIEYHMDPQDMWAATLRFAPRQHVMMEKENGS
jgi:hypothetical protein